MRLVPEPLSSIKIACVFQPLAHNVEDIDLLRRDEGGDSNRIIRQLGGGRGGVPTLHYFVGEALLRQTVPDSKPLPLDHVAAGRHRLLLVLRRERHRTHGGAKSLQNLPRLTLGVQRVIYRSDMEAVRTETHLLEVLRDRRKIEMHPAAGFEDVP